MRIVTMLAAALTAAACGGGASSPTAPSPVTSTPPAAAAPAPAPTPAPTPAPAPASVSGTWLNGGTPYMTLTQNGSTVSGTLAPVTMDLLGMIGTFTGTISGSASGGNVTLTTQVTMTIRAGSDSLTCRGADAWSGQINGNAMTGTFTPQITSYVCDGGIPLPTPPFPSGPMNFTRQ